jgi:hypothetical protein
VIHSSRTPLRFVALVFGVAVASKAAAQSPARFGMQAGATVPVSGYGDDKNVGYHIGLLVDARIPLAPFGFRVDGAFHELKYTGTSSREQIWMANANLMVKAPTGTPVVPYVIGGAGVYHSSRTFLFLGSRANTDLGVNVGGGIRLDLGDITPFLEARYHRVNSSAGIRILPITAGILF